jgi:hypothetical protein
MLEPMQFGDPASVSEWVVVFGQATDVLSALLGIAIAAVAWRGYRRNDSRPMLLLSLGFVLALAVPFALLLVVVVGELPQGPAGVATQTSQVLGLLAILYALWMPA